MSKFPETRDSLLARVKDPQDDDAWRSFVAVYRPVIYRLARRRGLQDADSQDLVQQVLGSVAQAISDWQPDRKRGRFRTWLGRITQNAITNAATRKRGDRGMGGSEMLDLLHQQADVSHEDPEDFDQEYQRSVFRWAGDQIRHEFHDSTWTAFWLTAVEGQTVQQTAEQLGKNMGAVYAARSRVMRRLRETVRRYEDSEDTIT